MADPHGLSIAPQEAARNLERWFARGVLREDNGSPLLLWHGDIDCGHRARVMDWERKGYCMRAVFFAVNPAQADFYDFESVHGAGGSPRAFYVRAERLLDLTLETPATEKFIRSWATNWDSWIDRYSGEPTDPVDLVLSGYLYDYEGTGSRERWDDMFAQASVDGYDAVRTMDATDGPTAPIVVTFSPHLIKSATWNSGTFSLEDPDIYDGAPTPPSEPVAATARRASEFAARLGIELQPSWPAAARRALAPA